MRNLTPALQSHVEGEVTSLVQCVEITRNDGIVLRMTEFDRDLVVGGYTYRSGCTFNMSAIKSSSDLSVDNATMDIGINDTDLTKADFERELLKRAKVYVFSVNWQSPDDGSIDLKRGWIGDVTLRDENWVTVAIRGLTQALQRNVLEQYSPTCRAEFGDRRCGMAIDPFTRAHRQGKVYKTGDWVIVANPSAVTNVPFPNSSFESNGNVTEQSPINNWTYGPNSHWKVASALSGANGTYYLQGGTLKTVGAGFVNILSQTMSATVAGMSAPLIDQGGYVLNIMAAVSTPSPTQADLARVTVVTYDNQGRIIQTNSSAWEAGEYGRWMDIGVGIMLRPGVRHFGVFLESKKSSGAVEVIFDNVRVSFFATDMGSVNSVVYKSVRVPGRITEDNIPFTNYRFAADGLVSPGDTITGWTNAQFGVVSNVGGLSAFDGAYFAYGGDNGTTTPSQEYTLISDIVDISAKVTDANLTAGVYLGELNVQRAHLDSSNTSKVTLEYLSSTNSVLGSADSGFTGVATTGQWENVRIPLKLPASTKKIRVTLTAKTGGNSTSFVGFGSVKFFLFNTAVAQINDPSTGRSADVRPTFNTTIGAFTYDGDLVWQTVAAPFGFDQVDDVADRRVFDGLNITGSEFSYYGAKITWLSGNNAGANGFVRTWVPSGKTLKTYVPAARDIAVGDKFLYTQGCNKTISDCATRFNNAINFRGEPYLPGQEKALQFFGSAGATG